MDWSTLDQLDFRACNMSEDQSQKPPSRESVEEFLRYASEFVPDKTPEMFWDLEEDRLITKDNIEDWIAKHPKRT